MASAAPEVAPERFSPDLLARRPARLATQFPLERCSRLTELLANSAGMLRAEFEIRRQGRDVRVTGQLETAYQLECQRCLQIYTHAVTSDFEFVLVPDEAAAEAVDEDVDPVVLDDEGMITVVELFEDELILLVPSVPKHETPDDCEFAVDVTIDEGFPGEATQTTTGETSTGERTDGKSASRNAFSVLKNLRF